MYLIDNLDSLSLLVMESPSLLCPLRAGNIVAWTALHLYTLSLLVYYPNMCCLADYISGIAFKVRFSHPIVISPTFISVTYISLF